jgi:ubiquinone/menaquinone biosynthesis C-methylase UbiE
VIEVTPGGSDRGRWAATVIDPEKRKSMSQPQNSTPAEVFDQFFGPTLFMPWAHLLLEHAQPLPGERVLDLACGTGTVARLVAPIVGPAGKVVALDIHSGMLAIARARPVPEGATIEWRQGDATVLDLPDDTFDLTLCQQGMQFFADRAAAAREMWRVLIGGGRVVLNLWQALHRHPVYEALGEAEARYLGAPVSAVAAPWSLTNAEELRALLEAAGFERITITPQSLDVHFPSAARFVNLTLFAAQAFLPQFDWTDDRLRSGLIAEVSHEIEPVVQQYRHGDRLSFPTSWTTAIAYKE